MRAHYGPVGMLLSVPEPEGPSNSQISHRNAEECAVQGVIKSYDPISGLGVLVDDRDRAEHELAPNALEGSVFRMLRQGQRVVFDLDDKGLATGLRLGSEVDLGAPDWTDYD